MRADHCCFTMSLGVKMTDHVEDRIKKIASELQGMRGNQRDMLTDLDFIKNRIPEMERSQKVLIWLVGCALLLVGFIVIRG